MRHLLTCAVVALCLPVFAQAQEAKFAVKIDQYRVGFRPYGNEDPGQFKVGLWTPVYVDVSAGPKPVRPQDQDRIPILEFECTDSEGVGTYYRVPVALDANETRTLMGYARPGSIDTAGKIGVRLRWEGKTYDPRSSQRGMPILDLTAHLYLSAGSRIPDLREALVLLAKRANQPIQDLESRDTGSRQAVFETDAARLPEQWFGYEGVDLLFLSTDAKFLNEMLRDSNQPRVKAIAQWVRNGGRLVIPVKNATQDLLARLLQGPAWQPPVPVIPPTVGNAGETLAKRLTAVEEWAGVSGKPFPGPGQEIAIAKLDPGQTLPGIWDVKEKTGDNKPLIARMEYGRGSIVYIAFPLDEAPFTRWEGRAEFLKKIVQEFAPAVKARGPQQQFGRDNLPDIATDVQRHMDNFDVSVVPFGYVALFIILYILVVGPLDYFILKHVFHKLEWTWITFPAVVIAVSVAAYFTAYALKGNDLRINKIDIVDFDLRTDLDEQGQPARAYAYGQSFFTVLSPRIQNYTVGIEPNPTFWGGTPKEKTPLTAEPVSWFGRPEFDGPGAYGRSGSQGFFRRPYAYAEDAKGLIGVPIPVWTSKAFSAAWETPLPKKGPFKADLAYHTREFQGKSVKLSGTIQNNLPVDLEEVWVFFGANNYPLPGGLPSSVKGAPPTKVFLQLQDTKEKQNFIAEDNNRMAQRNRDFAAGHGNYDPTNLIRQALFFERLHMQGEARDHSMRYLDFSWRMQRPEPNQLDTGMREVIIYGQVAFQRGQVEALASGPIPSPTKLWLGALPGEGKARPDIAGTLAQDTYVRILLPARLAPNN